MAQTQIQSVLWWYERLADWMIANPHKTLGEAAKYFDVRPNTISIIKNSDAFKEYWQRRSHEASHGIVNDIKDRMCAITEVALDRIEEKMQREEMLIGIDTYLDIAKMGLKGLGYGAPKGPGQTVNVNISQVDPELLARAREKMQDAFGINSNETKAVPAPPRQLETVDVSSEELS